MLCSISGNSEADLGGTSLSDRKAGGNVRALFELKEKYKHLKIILSIGGPANSKAGQFGNIRQIDSGWRDFALTAVNLMYDWGFDGINIHWEYLSSGDASTLGPLLKVCREQLKERSVKDNKYPYSLSMTTPGKYEQYNFLNFKEISDNVDFLFVKSYDYAAGGEVYTISHSSNVYGDRSYGSNATLYSTDDALKYYLDGGASPEKIILGIPLHGRAFTRKGKGLGDVGLPKLNSDTKDGAYYYKDLPIGNEEVDEELIAAWSYDAKDKAIYSYDNVQTVAAKVHYIKEMKLGGVVFSEAYGDKKDEDSLVFTACRKLCNLDRSDNQLNYPGSHYINISNEEAEEEEEDDDDDDEDEDDNKRKRAGIPQWKRDNKGSNCRDLCSA